jgi:DNA polymerase I-like protein with 3'-5' exonuclease and polymerase domains
LTPTKNTWACDIEADGLLEDATRIWCVCVKNVVTGEEKEFTDAEAFRNWLDVDAVLVGHNFIAYDLVMLNRFWDTGIGISRVVDTFVLSQLYNPVLKGGHSLESWGVRLKFPKGEFNEWSKFSEEMVEYCRRDTALTARLYNKLSNRMVAVGFSELGCNIEHLSWNIIQNKQRKHGFPFDKQKAELLLADLLKRKKELEDEIYKLWPPRLGVVKSFKRRRLSDGSDSAQYLRHKAQYLQLKDRDDGGYDALDFTPFNLGSPKQRIEKLLELGWEPSKFTPKGSPQVDEDSLLLFAESSGKKEVKALAKWLVVSSRSGMIRTWLDAYDEKTHAIHGKLFIASTLRYRHSNPNSANIPAVRVDKDKNVKYGEEGTWAYECRSLFTCGNGDKYRLVGIDAKGLQLRILANYAYSDQFVARVLDGDPHTNNVELLGLANKAAAKKFIYTLIMSGGGGRLAADQAQFGTKLTASDGHRLKKKMIASIPGFQDLIDRLQDELRRTGRITLCDGTPILVPSDHMVIPYLLQGEESRIMKQAMIWIDEGIRRSGIEAYKVADVHDEGQYVVIKEQAQEFVNLALAVFPRVGEYFNYKVPIEGDAKIGTTWAECH